jgi:glycosyltransferase involved in cell wall biosynthesis
VRIAYVCTWNLDRGDGVARKVAMQARAWCDARHDVAVFSLASGEARSHDLVRAYPFASARERLRQTARLVRDVRAYDPDVVYLRYDVFLPPAWALVRLRRTVVEANSDTGRAMRYLWESEWAARYNLVNRRMIFPAADGFVCVTHELARDRQIARWRAPTTVVANGIDTRSVLELPAPANERPRGIFLGSPRQPWHGVDKIVELARLAPELDFDVVGYTSADSRLIEPPIPATVTMHGMLPKEAYAPLLAAADFAVGSLAMDRAHLHEAGPLKVREYLASGIPTVIGYEDTDLVGLDPWWLLRLPNTDDNVVGNVERIRAWAHGIRGRRVPRAEVEPRIDAREKERRRLEFMAQVAA